MGAIWSSESSRGDRSQRQRHDLAAGMDSTIEMFPGGKRQRLMVEDLQQQQLIPGLPDEVALQVLARVPRLYHGSMRLVSRLWSEVMTSREVFKLRRELKITEEWLYVLLKDKEEELSWHSLDPCSGEWRRLPEMPKAVQDFGESSSQGNGGRSWFSLISDSGHAISEMVRGLLGRKATNERASFFGCSAAEVDGCLLVLGGFSDTCATSSVWKYDPLVNKWSQVTPMGTPRAYCKTGLLEGKLYVVGGVNKTRNGLTPLQSAEVYDVGTNTWSPMPSMSFVGAQVLPTAFMTDILKPIATGMAASRGQLWVPQSLYSWPFFMDIGGEVYDPGSGIWTEMPRGMGEGWPARQAGMKLSVVVGDKLYSLDPASSAEGSRIKVYDFEQDCWKVVAKKVPVLLDLAADAESPYLLCGLHSALHIVTKDAANRVTVARSQVTADAAPVSAASSSSSSGSSSNSTETAAAEEGSCWVTVASKSFGRVELVACQVLEL